MKMLLIIIVCVISITLVTYLRHFIPALHNFFVATQLDAPLNAVDASISQLIGGNPSAIVGIIGGAISTIVGLFKYGRDTKTDLINTFSQEKAELSGNMSSLQTQFDTLTTESTSLVGELRGTIKEQTSTITSQSTLVTDLQNQLITAQQVLYEQGLELKTMTTQKQELEIACQALTPTSTH